MTDYNRTITISKWEFNFQKFADEQTIKGVKRPWWWHVFRINEKGYWRPGAYSGDYKIGFNGDYRITKFTSWFAWIYAIIDALLDFDSPKYKREKTPEPEAK